MCESDLFARPGEGGWRSRKDVDGKGMSAYEVSEGVEPSLEVGAGAAGDKATELPQATLENEDHQPLLTSV